MTSEYRVSVIVPARNMGRYIADAIESALAQTYPVHEIIVIDDRSEDDTLAVLGRFGNRIRVLNGPGKGSAIARNLGILVSTGNCIAFLDADDLWMPAKIARQVERLESGYGFVCADFYREKDPAAPSAAKFLEYSVVAEGKVFSNLLRENFVATSSAMVRKELLAFTGLFKPQLIGGQDFDLWLRLAKVTQFGVVREPLAFLRAHDGNITGSRAYPYHHARVWEEILREHRRAEPDELSYMEKRCGASMYEAGRHAIRCLDRSMARHFMAQAWRMNHRRAGASVWYLLSLLPGSMLSALLESKRFISRRIADSPAG